MKIVSVNIPKDVRPDYGLEDIKMDRLGDIVILAGKNGSGKTRLLDLVFSLFREKPKDSTINASSLRISNTKETLKQLNETLINYTSNSSQPRSPFNDPERIRNEIKQLEIQLQEDLKIVNWDYLATDITGESYASVKYVPTNFNLRDCNDLSQNQLEQNAKNVNNIGMDQLAEGVLSKIQVLQNNKFNATHHEITSTDDEKKKAIDEYNRLQQMLELFLNATLTREVDANARLFGFPLGKSKLSEGQKVLLQLCIAIYSQEVSLHDLILILDEPENHLHPAAIIELINNLRKSVPSGQIWIATHSIPLLAHFDPNTIWYMDKNEIKHGGRIPEKVLGSLLGDQLEVAKLQDFIDLPSVFAMNRFAFECLFKPEAVMTEASDPQSIQIWRQVHSLYQSTPFSLLDFGAGQGRVLSNLFDLEDEKRTEIIGRLNYVAIDTEDKHKEQCTNIIKKVYSNSDNRYFIDAPELKLVCGDNYFQIVLMCNVLHEIPPSEWILLFGRDGWLSNLISGDGHLFIIEDYKMAKGEKPYKEGFIVLDTEQLYDLFKVSKTERTKVIYAECKDSQIKSHLIPASFLKRLDQESIRASIKSHIGYSQSMIEKIRGVEPTFINGRHHAFWVQQFANAHLCLKGLPRKSSKN